MKSCMGIREGDWRKIKQLVLEVHDVDGRLTKIAGLLKAHGYEVNFDQDKSLQNTVLYNVYAVRPANGRDALRSGMVEAQAAADKVWTNRASLVGDVQSFLRERLPDYMAPADFVLLSEMPLTPNGKLDRKALPAPKGTPTHHADMRRRWARSRRRWRRSGPMRLSVERVGRRDNFFELGGHSLLAVKVACRACGKRDYMPMSAPCLPRRHWLNWRRRWAATAVSLKFPRIASPPLAKITPEMLPLVELSAGEIDRIVRTVPGGAANVQDVYPLRRCRRGFSFTT